MPRKKKKTQTEKSIWKVGVYCRLSSEDGDNAESDSIGNQRQIIQDFLKNEDNWGYGNKNQTSEEKQKEFESLDLKSEIVLSLFNNDLEGEKNSKNLLLVLPAGKAAHIEAGIAYGLGKKCYAIGEYDATDTLYNIFETIFNSETELEEFLKKYSKR